jgi:hypothetical protein
MDQGLKTRKNNTHPKIGCNVSLRLFQKGFPDGFDGEMNWGKGVKIGKDNTTLVILSLS